MNEAAEAPATRAVVRAFPAAPNRENLTLREVVDAYMAAYDGRDTTRVQRLAFWVTELGDVIVRTLDADAIGDALDRLARTPTHDHRQRSPATVNRYRAALAAVLTWTKHRRLVPRGWPHPVREIRAERENNARTRFLSPDERDRLLKAARISAWPKLRLLILLALTTGARRGELLALRFGDVDLQRGTATLHRTKNGEPRVLPLTPAAIAEIKRHGLGTSDALVFASPRNPHRARAYETVWRTALRNARIEHFKFHDLRHSAASYLAQDGATLLELADFLGHRTMAMVKRYSHLTVESKRQLVHRVLGNIGGAS